MNKKGKQIVAIVLAGLILLSLVVSAFAEEGESGFEYYFCICDSLGNKPGGEMVGRPDSSGWLRNSYPVLLSEYLGLTEANEHFYGGRAGWRTNEIRYLLDDSFRRDAFASNEDWLSDYGGYTINYLDQLRPTYRENLRKADIVTVNIGSNDLAGNLLYAAQEVLKYNAVSTPCSRELMARLEAVKAKYPGDEAAARMLDVLATAENGVLLVKNVLEAFARMVYSFGANFDAMMKAIESYTSEDTTILVLGTFNCIGSMIDTNVKLPAWVTGMVSATVEPLFDYVNWHIRCGSAYASTYTYVDVSGVDLTGSTDGAHLGLAGHRYFFDRIVKAINSTLPCDHSSGTTLVNYRAPSKLIAGYSGDLKCDRCGKTVQTGKLLKPALFK